MVVSHSIDGEATNWMKKLIILRSNSAVLAIPSIYTQKLFLTIKENTVGLPMLCVIDTDIAEEPQNGRVKLPSFSFEILRQLQTM